MADDIADATIDYELGEDYQKVAKMISDLGVDDLDRLHQMTLDILGVSQDDPFRFTPPPPWAGKLGIWQREHSDRAREQNLTTPEASGVLAEWRATPEFKKGYDEGYKAETEDPPFRTLKEDTARGSAIAKRLFVRAPHPLEPPKYGYELGLREGAEAASQAKTREAIKRRKSEGKD
tara:strand:- start:51 stop:581 length:531 start_codon:yes stop_codon:yes gene_type:complete